ncbi:glycosyltransferase family 9 protein [Planctomycetota bacterium]
MNILLIQHRQIGDVLMCTPAVRALRKKYPDAEITFLVEPFSLNAVKYNPHINHFIVVPRKLSPWKYISLHWNVWRGKYDTVIDFFKNPKSAWLTWVSRAATRISLQGRHRNFAYTETVDMGSRDDYAAIQKLRLLKPLGIEEEKDCVPEFYISDTEREWAAELWGKIGFSDSDLVIAVSPVSRKEYRVWPSEYYAELCDHLADVHKAKILLTWGPGEEDFIKPIVKHMKSNPVTDYPMPSLTELYAILEKCSLFVGNNNGPRHMAVAAGIPTLGLFSKLSPSSWTPPDNPLHTVIQPLPETDETGKEVLVSKNLLPGAAIETVDRIIKEVIRGQVAGIRGQD